MRNIPAMVWVLIVVGVAVLGGIYWTSSRSGPVQVEVASPTGNLGGGPVLEITVQGEANGVIRVQLLADHAPKHVERIVALANDGAYDGVVFHRVIDGFMAQTGDVEFGNSGGDTARAGMGGSDRPDLAAEFSDIPYERGIVGMARSSNPNSANSQFFIMFAAAPNLNGQYTVVGQVIEGLEVLDAIKRGEGGNGSVLGTPDVMSGVKVVQ
ncbi:MAG: peptidylprolyl isomerase [Marinosulfonomonas sp.]|nr:peptidylprolyl isomerase [Marinosulfonomonas sp.]